MRIVLGVAGTSLLVYSSWLLYLLFARPWELLKMFDLKSYTGSGVYSGSRKEHLHEKLMYAKLLFIFILGFLAMYQLADWCLGWMPDDWFKRNQEGEWVTIRSSISVTFCSCAGPALLYGIGRGVLSRVFVDVLLVKNTLRDEIDDVGNVKDLKGLKMK